MTSSFTRRQALASGDKATLILTAATARGPTVPVSDGTGGSPDQKDAEFILNKIALLFSKSHHLDTLILFFVAYQA